VLPERDFHEATISEMIAGLACFVSPASWRFESPRKLNMPSRITSYNSSLVTTPVRVTRHTAEASIR